MGYRKMAKEVTKELSVKPNPPPPAVYRDRTPSVVDSSDIILPMILLGQGISNAVTSGACKFGDMYNSLTGEVVGDETKPLKFIPITLKKVWKLQENTGTPQKPKWKYRGTEAYTGQRYEYTEMRPSRYDQTLIVPWEVTLSTEVFGFTESDAADPISLPTVLSFSKSSRKAGQKVNTHFASLEGAIPSPLPYYAYVLELSALRKQNDDGIFMVWDIRPAMKDKKAYQTPKEFLPKIERWAQILSDSSKNVVVDSNDEETSEVSPVVDESRF
jgi:hypothetical protein